MNHMVHTPSPHSPLTRPPQYRKSSINQRKYNLYDDQTPSPQYCQQNDDKLPPYSPTLQLLTQCRRKNELDGKDKKSRNRKWEVVWLLLDGTALRIYQPTSSEKKQYEKEWNEKYCVKKDSTQKVSTPVEQDDESEFDSDEEETVSVVDSTIREVTVSSTRPCLGRGRSSSVAKTPFQDPPPSTVRPLPTRRRTNTITTTPIPVQSIIHPILNFIIPIHPNLPNILTRKPHISHPVRNIVCTRATTYFKRNFVLRFILEDGKQFMVQLNSHEETLVWLQIVPMAAPLALDLDERTMPDPSPYPRRRMERPQTAPAVLDSSRITNVPPDYAESTSPSSTAPSTPMRRRRSLDHI